MYSGCDAERQSKKKNRATIDDLGGGNHQGLGKGVSLPCPLKFGAEVRSCI